MEVADVRADDLNFVRLWLVRHRLLPVRCVAIASRISAALSYITLKTIRTPSQRFPSPKFRNPSSENQFASNGGKDGLGLQALDEILGASEPIGFLGGVAFGAVLKALLELAQQIFLLLGELHRSLHDDPAVQVP